MSERQVKAQEKKTFKKVDPFSGRVFESDIPVVKPHSIDWNRVETLGVELDKETGNTSAVVTSTVELDKQIQEYKDDCGFEGMANLIQKGRATPRDFYDDGKSGGDFSQVPDNIHDAYRLAAKDSVKSGNILRELGVRTVFNEDGSINIEATEKALTDAVRARFESIKPKEEVSDNGNASK